MNRSESLTQTEWNYLLEFLRREMKPVFIFMAIVANTVANISALIFFCSETVALSSSTETVYIAAIIYTAIVGVILAVQFLAEFLVPFVGAQDVYDSSSVDNVTDVWTYRCAASYQWVICSALLWADVVFQEKQCDSDSDLCLSDNYVPLHRISMFLCTIITINNIVVLSQTWYGYARINYDPKIIARRVYHQYILDGAYNSTAVETIVTAPPPPRAGEGKKRHYG